MELSEIKLYCHIEDDIEDTEVLDMQKAAEEYLLNAGISLNYEDFRYKLAVKMLISHWYENRGALIIGSISKDMEHGLDSLLTQLQLSPKVVV